MDVSETNPADQEQRNFVALCGRVSIPAGERRLPSGDRIVTTRVVVDRPSRRAKQAPASRRQVDAIDCVAWTSRLQRVVGRWRPGDEVYVEGALRRRFFRAEGGPPASRWEIELTVARLVRANARAASRSAARDP